MKNLQARLKDIQNIYRQKMFQPYVVKKNIQGLNIDFLIGDLTAEEWYNPSKESQKKETDVDSSAAISEEGFAKQNLIQPDDIVFECGGHHGMTAILLSNWVGDRGKVVTFEPMRVNVEIIKRNLKLNSLNNVSVEHKAVGAQSGSVKLYRQSNGSVVTPALNFIATLKLLFYGVSENIEVISLDRYVQQNNLTPTVLKIDVEGYEAEVLKGAKNLLEKKPKIWLEIHGEVLSRYNTSAREILSLLDLSRYQCWIQWQPHESPVPFDPEKDIQKRVHLFAIPK